MTLFENAFIKQLVEFTDLQQQKNKAPEQPWHRAPMPGMNDTHPNIVADRYKKRLQGRDADGNKKQPRFSGELNTKIEAIRNGTSDIQILTKPDLKYIFANYNVNEIPKDQPKTLFDGVVASWDMLKNSFVLKRDERN